MQSVKQFTRVRGNQKPSLIDLVITEDSQSLHDTIKHDAPIGKSDHCVLRWNYLVSVNETPTIEDDFTKEKAPKSSIRKWNVDKGDYNQLNGLISEVRWDELFKGKDLNEQVDLFYEEMEKMKMFAKAKNI